MSFRAVLAAATLSFLAASYAVADAPRFVELHPSKHFVIIARRCDITDYDPKGIVDRKKAKTIAKRCSESLEFAYDHIVKTMGYKCPHRPRLSSAARAALAGTPIEGRTLVILRRFRRVSYAGFVRATDCHIRLNLERLKVYETYRPDRRDARYRMLLGHELFHTVQMAYDSEEARWLLEATANWMEYQLDPRAAEVDKDQPQYLKYPWLALDRCVLNYKWDTDTITGKPYTRVRVETVRGRPYGAGIFFGFLALQHPAKTGVVRQVWETCGGRKGDDALEALRRVCGGEEAFRGYFDRFAMGCLLGIHAPKECLHPRIKGSGSAAGRAVYHVLTGWKEHHAKTFDGPARARLAFDSSLPESPADGGVDVLGTRFLALPLLPGPAPTDQEACVALKAGPRFVSLQAAGHDGIDWRVWSGPPYVTYEPTAGVHLLRVPGYGELAKPALLAITRYGSAKGTDETVFGSEWNYQFRAAAACPPVVKEVVLEQRGRVVHRSIWTPRRGGRHKDLVLERSATTPAGGVPRRANGAAEVHVRFTAGVEPPAQGALLTFDGKPVAVSAADANRTWKGTIAEERLGTGTGRHLLVVNARAQPAGTRAWLPLDQDPRTVAVAGWDTWTGYERDGPGTRVHIRKRTRPTYTLKVTPSRDGAPPHSARLHLVGESATDDPIVKMWIDPLQSEADASDARDVVMTVGRRFRAAGDYVQWLELPRSGRKEIRPDASKAELSLSFTWWERGTHVVEFGVITESGGELVKRSKMTVWKRGEGKKGDESGTPGANPEVTISRPTKPIDDRSDVHVFEIAARTRSGHPLRRVTLRPAVSNEVLGSDTSDTDCAEPLTFRPDTLRVTYQFVYRFAKRDGSSGNDYDAIVEVEDAAGNHATARMRVHAR